VFSEIPVWSYSGFDGSVIRHVARRTIPRGACAPLWIDASELRLEYRRGGGSS